MDTKRQFALGLFFVVAITLLVFYTLVFTDFTLFRDQVTEEVYFPAANGLREGDPVMISGLRIGRVKSLEANVSAPPRERILATLTLNERVQLNEGFRVSIQESTLLGGRQIDIDPGEYGGREVDRAQLPVLYGDVEQNPIAALGELGDLLSENREKVRNIVSNLDSMVSGLQEGRGVLGRLIADEEMGADLSATVANLRGATDDVRAGRGLVGRLVSDQALADRVSAAVDDISTMTADVRAGRGLVGRLLYDEELSTTARRAVDDLGAFTSQLQSGQGVAGKLFSDEALAQEFETTVKNLRQTSDDLASVTAHVRGGEGTIGKLVMDDELYQHTLDAVRLITRTLEDYREAAPIATFTNVLFGAF